MECRDGPLAGAFLQAPAEHGAIVRVPLPTAPAWVDIGPQPDGPDVRYGRYRVTAERVPFRESVYHRLSWSELFNLHWLPPNESSP